MRGQGGMVIRLALHRSRVEYARQRSESIQMESIVFAQATLGSMRAISSRRVTAADAVGELSPLF